jgi:hypothetical protein
MEEIFLMTGLNSLIKIVIRQKRHYAVSDVKASHRTGLCIFKMTFIYSLRKDYESRRNGLQGAQHLFIPDPLR